MAEQFRTRKVVKTYHALVAWVPEPREGIINAPLLRLDTGKTDEAKVVVDPQGQTAETSYRVLKTSPEVQTPENSKLPTFSLVELHPKTGRTHQIRVHMAHIGCPLIGDRRYGWPNVVKFPNLIDLHDRRWHLLSAHEINFTDIQWIQKIITLNSGSFC
jgi:23S rRNA-/tRNA-specific pseudouridylate synthase